jgi:hypothetical protein
VLQDKLAVILAELGVDKTNDVLASMDLRVDQLYETAILEPDHVTATADSIVAAAKADVAETEPLRRALGDSLPSARRARPSTLRQWLEIADAAAEHLRVSGQRVGATLPEVVGGEPVPVIAGGTAGWWTMWEIRAGSERTAMTLFITDSGAVRPDLAERMWTSLALGTDFHTTVPLTEPELCRLRSLAADHAYRDTSDVTPSLTLRLAVRAMP